MIEKSYIFVQEGKREKKKMKRKAFVFMLSCCILLWLFPMGAYAQVETKVFEVNDQAGLLAAVTEINAANDGSYAIRLTDDVTLQTKCEFSKNTTTIYGQGHSLTVLSTVRVYNQGTILNLGASNGSDSLIIDGQNTRRTTAMIACTNGAVLNMYSGVTVKDAYNSGGASGSGIFVQGTFNMHGGTITGCDGSMIGLGGAVAVHGGTFNMYAGTITQNEVSGYGGEGGGVLIYADQGPCTFNMFGGTISENYAAGFGGGVCIVQVKDDYAADFYLHGGVICDNRTSGLGGGVYYNNDGFTVAPKATSTVIIQGNKKVDSQENTQGSANNVYVYNGQTIRISGSLYGSKIGITEQEPTATFTMGYPSNNPGTEPATYFTSDDPAYIVCRDDDQEATLGRGALVTFAVENGTWADGTKEDRIIAVVFSEQEYAGTLMQGQIPTGMLANPTYGDGTWSPLPDTSTGAITGDVVYTYTFIKKPMYTVTYTDGVDDEIIFEDQVITQIPSGTKTPAFDGTPWREGYRFIGWDRPVSDVVSEDIVYTACWEKEFAGNDPSTPNIPPHEVPKTGEEGRTTYWASTLFLLGAIWFSLGIRLTRCKNLRL